MTEQLPLHTENPFGVDAWEVAVAKERLAEERAMAESEPANILESIATVGDHPLKPVAEVLIENGGSIRINQLAKESGLSKQYILSLGSLKGTFEIRGNRLETPLIPRKTFLEQLQERVGIFINNFPLRPIRHEGSHQPSLLWTRGKNS